ncbi:MAG: carbohydrate kinase family protein [Anaerolineae bacterium]
MTDYHQAHIAVIGGTSQDILHFQGRTEPSIGGAGLYTALAARRAGVQVTMFAPRPEPMPPAFGPAVERVRWIGPPVLPEDLPSFEIAHHGGGHSQMIQARWGAEALLTPENLPEPDLRGTLVYVVPFEDPARQLAFLGRCKALGCRTAAGTYPCAVQAHAEVVLQTFAEADIFFCNESEASGLFGSVERARTAPGKLLFITQGGRGALVVQGQHRTQVPGLPVSELDPTGAGDTFCGTTLALLALGWHPVEAARQAVAAAAEMITAVGPTALLQPPPPPPYPADPRACVNRARVQQVANLIAALPEVVPFSFTGQDFPPLEHPQTLDFFFASTLQQFGFWHDDGRRYRGPMIAPINGQERKGSDYLWAAYRRWLDQSPRGLTPAGQAGLTTLELRRRGQSDTGDNPLPAFRARLGLARGYGHEMLALGWSPADVVARANASDTPLQTFLAQLDHVAGYKEDPLRKKSVLLAVILQQRPEQFLRANPAEPVPPIIDYHLQRSCLRIGLVDVTDETLRRKLGRRSLLRSDEEWAVRRAAHEAVRLVQQTSNKGMGAVDWFFFGARRRCPEMTEPDCAHCPMDPVCAHRKGLFQPVRRTTFY